MVACNNDLSLTNTVNNVTGAACMALIISPSSPSSTHHTRISHLHANKQTNNVINYKVPDVRQRTTARWPNADILAKYLQDFAKTQEEAGE